MSLVNYFVCEEFLLFCGDQRAIDSNGEIASDNYIKVKKSSKNVLFGFTGESIHNYALCRQYVKEDLTFAPLSLKHDYNQVREQLKINIKQFENENQKYELACCIGGWNGEKLCITVFHVDKTLGVLVEDVLPTSRNDIRYGSLSFNQQHLNNFRNILQKNATCTVLNYKNAFRTTVEMGSRFDKSINSNCTFEVLRKKTFI